VEELGSLALDGGDDARVGMAGCDDGDTGGEIEEAVGIDVFGNGAFAALHDEGIAASVGGREDGVVALDDFLCLGAGQRSDKMGQKRMWRDVRHHREHLN